MASNALMSGLQRASQGQRALDFIKGQLVTGCYAPGDTLPIDSLATEIGVSRQTVLEAMRSLAKAGLVSIVPQVGCQVAVHTSELIGDFFLLFARVEGMLAGLAAARHAPAQLHRLRSIESEIAALLAPEFDQSQRGERHRILNHEFHGHIHSLAQAPEIAVLAKSFWDRSDFHLATTPDAQIYADRLAIADHEHEDIIVSIQERDQERAEKLMRDHVLGFRSAVLEGLRRSMDDSIAITRSARRTVNETV